MKLCEECAKRDGCTSLCQAAERFVGADHVSQREVPLGPPLIEAMAVEGGQSFWASGYTEDEYQTVFPYLGRLEVMCLYLFYERGYTYREIARALSGNHKWEINRDNVRDRIYRAKQKIKQHFLNKQEKGG